MWNANAEYIDKIVENIWPNHPQWAAPSELHRLHEALALSFGQQERDDTPEASNSYHLFLCLANNFASEELAPRLSVSY